jgi:hypothetical protein
MSETPQLLTHTSATAIDLGDKLTQFIREYRGTRGGVTDTDVRHALRLAEHDTGVSLRRGTVSVLATGFILAGVFAYLLYQATTGPGQLDLSVVAVFGSTLVLSLLIVYLIARR